MEMEVVVVAAPWCSAREDGRDGCCWCVADLALQRCETERQQMREEEDTICVEMMRKLWWLTQIYFRMGATPARSMADGAGKTAVGREKKMVAPARREMEVS
ncbi:hypothetical protein DEO72_LG6g1120 [Vigna unguiculata]|uniref:Uncharacterized protein n=1 Tax=Vigna unguiculata TaxID=3917 RepID=A0A4D6M6C1_VIGUN|nr:hypothetical protein DEO72_LG6g1120 [Vigna unguiculata]